MHCAAYLNSYSALWCAPVVAHCTVQFLICNLLSEQSNLKSQKYTYNNIQCVFRGCVCSVQFALTLMKCVLCKNHLAVHSLQVYCVKTTWQFTVSKHCMFGETWVTLSNCPVWKFAAGGQTFTEEAEDWK